MSASSYRSLEEGRVRFSLYDRIFKNTKIDRVLDLTLEALAILFVLGTFVYLIIVGIKERHMCILIDACLVGYFYCELKLIKYYRKGELEPKFKRLILGIGFSILIQSALSIFIVCKKY
ncbi:hypothetical protein BCR32DRAFT_276860 [Anaeromyces robustus]|uniref:Uncharacterized protein n=1 Tax=Anaeromyces robustus TaxID=1754192 RepID=A0A1Y1XGB3_9FUNG|nr:hypothetical protein BCR32DRAFT_276860 [Anaeromyces robustus]|eukprot:ORX84767.1 hypothetical protein BCR32DRAFT_276860 [Anaeromyces robustus]